LSVTEQAKLADRFIQALAIKTPSREQTVRNLSGGNQQKVLLARWLATDEASRYSGINAKQVKFLVYTFSGFCAGLAGLVACSNIKSADANNIGLYLELDAILAVVVGGTSLQGGRFYLIGAVVGGLFIQTLTTTLYARNVSSDISPVPKALAIIAACLFQSESFRSLCDSPKGRATRSRPALCAVDHF
jgi:hypothetical protein